MGTKSEKFNRVSFVNTDTASLPEKGTNSSDVPQTSAGFFKNGQFEKRHGMHWFIAALFVVGDMAGAGVVALPTALVQTQFWPGLLITALMGTAATISAIMLGRCWSILLQTWPEYRTHCRKPYAEIGFRALGRKVKTVVSICLNLTQFGISVVFLLLASKNIHDFMSFLQWGSISPCYVALAVGICILPITFLKSPEDFWWAVLAGMISTAVAVVLLTTGAMMDYETCAPSRGMPEFRVMNYFLAMGTVLFTYGGHSAFPTIQHDMRKPSEFTKSAVLAFIIITLFYFPVGISGFLAYGNSLRASIINSVQTQWIQQAVNLMITSHCLLTLTLVINPLNQETEEVLNVPQEFGWKRVVVRTCVMAGVVFTAETVPSFEPLMDLMGGSTLTLTSLIFPCIFYLYLQAGENMRRGKKESDFEWEPVTFKQMIKHTERKTLIACGLIIVFAIACGGAATFSSLKRLSSTGSADFALPCYVQPFVSSSSSHSNFSSTNCCGRSQTIARFSSLQCSDPDLEFYHA